MKFISLKEEICRSLGVVVNDPLLKGNKIFFLTPIGFISGKISSLEEKQEPVNKGKIFYDTFWETTTEAFEDKLTKNTDSVRAPHDGCVLLNEVEIQSLDKSNVVRLDHFVLFIDSIIGTFLADTHSTSENGQK